MVSISCITYNHESYIADTIKGFLMQETNFQYEILIHDDASTDRTPEIIKEYAVKYPDLIKPIYQTENQYSKGVKVGRFNRERAKGTYIATCEGDDYWIDPFKLQKQVDYMQKHPDCSLCVHAAYRVRPDKKILNVPIRPYYGNKIFTVEEVIIGGGGLFATNSMLYPTVLARVLPDFFEIAPAGDYPMAIYLALKGNVYYIDEFMSAYRVGVQGSWTERISSNMEKCIEVYDKLADMLNEINIYSEYKYNTIIEKAILLNKFNMMLKQGLYEEVNKEEFKEIYSALAVNRKIGLFIKRYLPGVAKILIKLKRKLRK